MLSHDSEALTLDMIAGQDFAARLTSTGPEDGPRYGSVKIGGTATPADSDTQPDPEPALEPQPDPAPLPDPANLAADDSMTVSNRETFNDGAYGDPLDGFQFSLLDKDVTSEGGPNDGAVTSPNATLWTERLIVQGSNGGLLLVFADGTIDFSANGAFDHLGAGETDTTQFAYTIEGGSSALLDVLVFSDGSGGGPGDDGWFPGSSL